MGMTSAVEWWKHLLAWQDAKMLAKANKKMLSNDEVVRFWGYEL